MYKNEPLISIIIPLFNAEKYIEDTILSVVGQTYSKWELIVVDDCSQDGSVSIVQRMMALDSRIQLIEAEENFGGPAKPRNMGMAASNGDYIAFLDNDDVWLPKKLEMQMDIFFNNEEVDIVHSLADTIDSEGNRTGVFKNQKTFSRLKYLLSDTSILFISNYVNINTAVIKSDIRIDFREDVHLIALEDWAFWIDNKLNGREISLINEKLLNYRVLKTSASGRGSSKTYRKIYYMYSTYLCEMKITLGFFMLLLLKNTLNLFLKSVTR
jgi:teichuronic acid biosynthesis glycosyltransferase TuaG